MAFGVDRMLLSSKGNLDVRHSAEIIITGIGGEIVF